MRPSSFRTRLRAFQTMRGATPEPGFIADLEFLENRDLDLSVRIGVATGDVMAGNAGGGGRQSYTVYGYALNIAARLEEMNKDYGTAVLFTESTARLAAVSGTRRMGNAVVRGVNAPVAVYSLAE